MSASAVQTSDTGWLKPRADGVPSLLQEHARWMLWARRGDRKTPRAVRQPLRDIDPTNSKNHATFEELLKAEPTSDDLGFGFALGRAENDVTFAGVDIDKCRNPQTGCIEPWARDIINFLNSYSEISPSGTGVKIFCLAKLDDDLDLKQGKVYKLEIYDRARYFTVTGHHLAGTPTTVEPREPEIRALHARQRSNDLIELTKLFGLFQQDRGDWMDIICPWADEHSQHDGPRDAALHVDAKKRATGFHCFHGSHAESKRLPDVLRLFNVRQFAVNRNDNIVGKNQANIHRALETLGVTFSRDTFAQRSLITHGGKTQPLDDPNAILIWLEIDKQFGLLPPKTFFIDIIEDAARKAPFHPVLNYLASLTWDGTKRVDTWLTDYGKAKDTQFNRTVGAIVLIAAVRRVKQPGIKFDELLIFISKQGHNKSTALKALCPKEAWFSDDLPLNVDAKQIIERTSGKWLIEVPELNGFGKRETDHLKASLSRQVDGPVRLAYGRLPVEVPRQFITIGTTNTHQFLKDKTGNRRFWPVAVQQFDVAALRRDRDQLWAEAAHREALGESIRLDPAMYETAARQQEKRQIEDPWCLTLREVLHLDKDESPNAPPREPSDRVLLTAIWDALGIENARRDERASERLNAVMQSLGYEKKQARGLGADSRSAKRWCRITGQLDLDEAEDHDDA